MTQAEVGEKQLLRLALTFDPSKIQVARGVRNALGVFIPLALGVATGHLVPGLAASGGAVMVGFADVGAVGSNAARAKTLGLSIIVVLISVLVGTLTGGLDWLTVVLMAIWGFAAGMCVALGQGAGIIGLLFALSLLLSAFYPGNLEDALIRSGLSAAGGLLQAALALTIWPLHPLRPEREAVAAGYHALGAFAGETAAGKPTEDRVPALVNKLDDAQTLLDDAEGRRVATTPAGEAFRTLIVEGDRAYPEIIALGHVRGELPPRAAAAAQDALVATGAAMHAIAEDIDGGVPSPARVDALRQRLRDATTTIGTEGDGPGPHAAALLEALRGQMRAAVDAAVAWGEPGSASPTRTPVRRRRALFPHDALAILRANFGLDSTAFRHALRMGVTLGIAVALYRILPLPRGYWIPLTVAFVMRPDFGSTFSRGLQRYVGTVVGSVAATALTAFLDPGDWTLAILVGLFSAVFYATLFANYAIFTTAITGMIVFFVAFEGVNEWTAVVDRLIDTGIGGALALGAYALFPTWEGDHVQARLGDLIHTDAAYCRAVLRAWIDPKSYDRDALHNARLAARRARTEAEGSISLAQAEPARHRGDIGGDLGILAVLRRLADSALALEADLENQTVRHARPPLAPLALDFNSALATLEAAAREGRAPAALPRLRAEHHAFTETQPEGSLVVGETDRMVNAINTLGHQLGA